MKVEEREGGRVNSGPPRATIWPRAQVKTSMMWPSQNFLLYFPINIQVIKTNIYFCAISYSRRRHLVITKIMEVTA